VIDELYDLIGGTRTVWAAADRVAHAALRVAHRCKGQSEFEQAETQEPHSDRRPKTNQREFSDHLARQDDSRKYCGALGEQVTPE
jgi:hypothetical protein